jgi:hypothetical protein
MIGTYYPNSDTYIFDTICEHDDITKYSVIVAMMNTIRYKASVRAKIAALQALIISEKKEVALLASDQAKTTVAITNDQVFPEGIDKKRLQKQDDKALEKQLKQEYQSQQFMDAKASTLSSGNNSPVENKMIMSSESSPQALSKKDQNGSTKVSTLSSGNNSQIIMSSASPQGSTESSTPSSGNNSPGSLDIENNQEKARSQSQDRLVWSDLVEQKTPVLTKIQSYIERPQQQQVILAQKMTRSNSSKVSQSKNGNVSLPNRS